MLLYICRHSISFIVTLLLASTLVFFLVNILPGDTAQIMLGMNAQEDTLRALRKEMGLDQPLLYQYFNWLNNILQGDFGISYTYKTPVADLIFERLEVTLPLAFLSLLFALMIAFPLGILAADHHKKPFDWFIRLWQQCAIAIPNFWMGIILIVLFSLTLRWLPAGSFPGWDNGILDSLKALILPVLALTLPEAALMTKLIRSTTIDIKPKDFVRTAKAKGVTNYLIYKRHILPHILIPCVALLGLQISHLLMGTIIIENTFSLPGLGKLIYKAVNQRDFIVLQNCIFFFLIIIIVINFIIEMLYVLIDPRIKESRVSN